MKSQLIYLYDALCGWCYGFSPVLQQAKEKYQDHISFETMSGGMMLGPRTGPLSEVAPYIRTAYRQVEATTGVRFGEGYIQRILTPGTAILSSEMPGVALTVFRHYRPDDTLSFAHALQNIHYFDGLDLNDTESYRTLAEEFGLPAEEFLASLHDEKYRYETTQEFQTVANWGISGFPTVLLRPHNDRQYFMIAKGYTPFERIDAVITTVLGDAGLL